MFLLSISLNCLLYFQVSVVTTVLRNMSSNAEISVKYLSSDPDYYAECFRVYRRYTSKDEVFTCWADKTFPHHVIEKLALSDEGQTQLEILGVGSGSGKSLLRYENYEE